MTLACTVNEKRLMNKTLYVPCTCYRSLSGKNKDLWGFCVSYPNAPPYVFEHEWCPS